MELDDSRLDGGSISTLSGLCVLHARRCPLQHLRLRRSQGQPSSAMLSFSHCRLYSGVRRGAWGSWPQWLHDSTTINNIIVSGEAILSAENSGKPSGGRCSTPNPAGGVTALPRLHSWWGGGCCPLLRNPTPTPAALGFRPLSRAPMKNPGHAPGSLFQFSF